MKSSILFISILLISVSTINCKNTVSERAAQLDNIGLIRGEIKLCGGQEFGVVNFSASCNSDSREPFNLGISLLHSFEYEEAEKSFVKAIDADPDCVMAYWGVAMSNFHALWNQQGTKHLEKGAKILEIAQGLSKTDREQDYLDAIHAFYKDWETVDHSTRKSLFENKMEQLYLKYPDDKEAAIFYALALNTTASPADKTYKNQKKAGKILESLLPDQPDHPGISHYIIHTYDYPELASLALPTARKYASIAPSSAHAQHMPSHIFTRLGLWDESIKSNLNSTASALCYSQSVDSSAHWDEELHGMDYLVYAYLQIGDKSKAIEQHNYLRTFKKIFPENFKVSYSVAAIPARIALENKNWSEAANLEFPSIVTNWDDSPWEKSILNFARAMGSVRTGDVAAANKELEILKTSHKKLLEAKDAYKANQVLIQIKSIEAWITFKNGASEKALALMQEAADMEYKTGKHPVTPSEVIPAGELLGDLLMEMGDPIKALKAYEFDLKQHPNRFNGLYGAAKAAHALNNKEKANKYFQLLINQSINTSNREELKEAKKSIHETTENFQ